MIDRDKRYEKLSNLYDVVKGLDQISHAMGAAGVAVELPVLRLPVTRTLVGRARTPADAALPVGSTHGVARTRAAVPPEQDGLRLKPDTRDRERAGPRAGVE